MKGFSKLRILCLFLADSYESYTGGERQFIEICKIWKRLGNEIHIIANTLGIMLCKRFGLTAKFYALKEPSVKIAGLEDFVVVREMLNRVPDVNFDFIYCPEERFPYILASVILKRKIKVPLICSVNLLSPEDTGIASSLKQVFAYSEARTGVKYVWAIPGRFLFFFKKMLRNFFFLKKMDIIFSVSPFIKKLLVKLGIDERRLFVVNVGVDRSLIQKIASQSLGDKSFDACFLGNIIPRKGVIDLIKAWKIVNVERPKAKLLIIGKGSGTYFEKVKALVKNYGLLKNVIFSGFVPEREKYTLLSQSKIFVFPSYLEGNPLAICEALSCGIPVIAYDFPYYREIYGDALVYVKKGDFSELANAILSLLKDELFKEKMRNKYVELSKNLDWENIAKYELEIIQKCLLVKNLKG